MLMLIHFPLRVTLFRCDLLEVLSGLVETLQHSPPRRPNRSLEESCCGESSRKIRASLVTGHFRIEVEVLSIATLTLLSLLGNVSVILARGQWLVNRAFSRITTKSPGCKLVCGDFHFCKCCNCCRYSADHLLQKCWTSDWQRIQRRSVDGGLAMVISG